MIKKLLLYSINFYRKFLSPLWPSTCRYWPTCSSYMVEAVEKYGVKGVFMGINRVLYCIPFIKGGYDPVPEKFGLCLPKKQKSNE